MPRWSPTNDAAWPVALPDEDCIRDFRRRLLAWYARHARDLPWRRTRDPYAVWVSEIMLQQTQVATVEAYFGRFTEALPGIKALAAAPEQQVLRLWEGLGYYRRALQLHRAAGVIVKHHGGRFPQDRHSVQRLPGIGRYTAGAILSIAFDQPEPILEANTTRLLCRLLAYRQPPQRAEGQRLLWTVAGLLVSRRAAGRFNQALMELGSTVCTPRNPRCPKCPVAARCAANQQGLQEKIPTPVAKPPNEALREAAVIVRHRGKLLLLRRGDKGRWAGLWDFPRFALAGGRPAALRDQLRNNVAELTGVLVEPGPRLTTIKHGVTRFRITLEAYTARYLSGKARPVDGGKVRWIKPAELDDYPLSVTGRKLSQLLGA